MMIKLFHVDAFSEIPFSGNPAGVCLLDKLIPEYLMQSIATEINLSETAFIINESNGYNLRWFTPKTEVSLCGHATLASSHILWEIKELSESDEIKFYTKSGLLKSKKNGSWIQLDFPTRNIEASDLDNHLNEAIGTTPVFTGKYTAPTGDLYLLELEKEEQIRNLAPDFKLLISCRARAVIVTSRSNTPKYDFVSRYFAPVVGINEDPVTGSSHCILAPYWSGKLNKTTLIGYQASQRGGIIRCTHAGDRVLLEGKAVTIYKAELSL
jgi:PhzF family phenazine biosynthesis protein